MYLKKFDVKNFRSFDEDGIELLFNKGVTAIIGENNSGKSAIIDALRIACSFFDYRRDLSFARTDFHVGEDGIEAEWAQFDLYFGDVPMKMIEIWDPESENGTGGEFHIRFEKYATVSGAEKVRSNAWGFGVEANNLSSLTLDSINCVYLGALRDAEREMKPSRYSKLAQLMKKSVQESERQAELVEILNEANGKLLSRDEITGIRSTINNNLRNIEQDFLSQQIDIGLVEPRFDSIAASLRVWVKPKWVLINNGDAVYDKAADFYENHTETARVRKDEKGIYFEVSILNEEPDMDDALRNRINEISALSFELYQNGLGYNNLLYMSTVLGDMEIGKDDFLLSLLLVEEPEAHLHPQLQVLVHSFLDEANKNNSNLQVIYTSHSPTLASKISIDNVNLVYTDGHRISCLPFSRARLSDSEKNYLQKYLDVTKSQMLFARGILFVEGISERLLIPAMAEALDRPLEKYAVELVDVGSVAFKPFIRLFSSDSVKTCFSKVSIVTDDDRCTEKSRDDYIDKNLDYDDINDDVIERLRDGKPSGRCARLENECLNAGIHFFKARKTLEYELCCSENNIYHMVEAIKMCYPHLGKNLEEKISSLPSTEEKAACVWLFVRARNKSKGMIAQYISDIIREQTMLRKNGEAIEREFDIPEYLRRAIYSVTEH